MEGTACCLLADYSKTWKEVDKLREELLHIKKPGLDDLGNSWPVQMAKATKTKRFSQASLL